MLLIYIFVMIFYKIDWLNKLQENILEFFIYINVFRVDYSQCVTIKVKNIVKNGY